MAPVTTPEVGFLPEYAVPPGETIADLLEEREMTQTDLARRLGVSLKHANQVIKGTASISAELALGLEKVFGASADFWLNRESHYQADIARQEETRNLSDAVGWAKGFPVRELKKRGFLSVESKGPALVSELLRFLGIASPALWRDPIAAFRKSLKYESDPYALDTWLRVGELRASEITCGPYDPDQFRAALMEVRGLTRLDPKDWHPRLVHLCASSGVAVVIEPTFPRARANGATRWLTPIKALIQLSLRYAWEDIFWFSFFHEAAHVLLHRKKHLFIEGLDSQVDSEVVRREEDEANRFAGRFLIPREHEPELAKLALARVSDFADHLGIAPAIVVGRLQHEGLLQPNQGNHHRRRLVFTEE
jgi:HTH-type transcriptional regulator / antitoxin HigA